MQSVFMTSTSHAPMLTENRMSFDVSGLLVPSNYFYIHLGCFDHYTLTFIHVMVNSKSVCFSILFYRGWRVGEEHHRQTDEVCLSHVKFLLTIGV